MACFSIGLSNSRLTSFSPSMASVHLDKHDIHAQANSSMLRGCQAIVLHRSPALYFRSNSIVFISTVGFSNEDNCCQSEGIWKSLKKKTLLKGILRVD